MRFHTAITERGRRYLEKATASSRRSATKTPSTVVSAEAVNEPMPRPPPVGPLPTSTPPMRGPLGVATTAPPLSTVFGSQPLSRRHSPLCAEPRSIGVYVPSAVGSNGIHPYGSVAPLGAGKYTSTHVWVSWLRTTNAWIVV